MRSITQNPLSILSVLSILSSVSAQCNVTYINSLVSQFELIPTVTYKLNVTTANMVSDYNVTPDTGGPDFPSASNVAFCNVTLALKHNNLNDNVRFPGRLELESNSGQVLMQFWLPTSSAFKNRYLSAGGGGWSVSGTHGQPGGLPYGAASGITDGGFGGFSSSLTTQLLSPVNGTIEWSRLESFAYQAIHEMTVTGKELTNAYYKLANGTLKAYYQGCSEGGREGHMSTQRFPMDFDGVIAAAPAMYFPVHQLAQGWPNLAMAELNHWPSPCAFLKVLNDTIAACDGLDGLVDGVVSRSDFCNYDAVSSVGNTYSGCTAAGTGAPTNGTISQADANVINAIYKGAFDSNGDQIFWAYRNASRLTVEAGVAYNSTSGKFGPSASPFFNTYYQNLVLKNQYISTVDYNDFTVDDVFQLMEQGIQDYGSWTETTWPDLSDFQARGGKLIHWHGEADTNLFPEASAHFHEKVKAHMFPNTTSYAPINEFYRFFIVPGAGHCSINPYQPGGPYPQYALQQLIDWVEEGTAPAYLNGTTESGSSTQPQICLWPTRPSWSSSGTFSCVNETVGFIHPLKAWKVDY